MDIIFRFYFRIIPLICFFGYILCTPVVADEELDGARKILIEVTQKMFDELNSQREKIKSDPELLKSLIKKNLEINVSIETASRRVVGGKRWKIANDAQRKEFAREFRDLLLNFYSSGLREYLRNANDELHMGIVKFGDPVRSRDNEQYADVDCYFRLDDQAPYKVIYRMIHKQDRWKVYDVVIPQGSVVRNYRMQFRGKLRTAGIDGLIDALKKRNGELLSRVKQSE